MCILRTHIVSYPQMTMCSPYIANETQFFVTIIGGLHIRRESDEDVLHGRLWYKLSEKNTPQRIILALDKNLSSVHPLR